MNSQQQAVWTGPWSASWSCVHGPLRYELAASHAPYPGCEYARGPAADPRYCSAVTADNSEQNTRRFLLDRSVFDLVHSHSYLSLTDPQLLGWYLRLSPEDRKLIQDQGGFHQFLQRHPALGLSRHHVYVKFNSRGTGPAQPAVTSQKKPGGKKCTCEEELRKLPSPMREALSVLSCCSDTDQEPPQKPPQEELVQTQDHVQPAFSYHSYQDSNQPEVQSGPSLFELNEEQTLGLMTEEKPELWSQTGTTRDQRMSNQSAPEHESSKYYSFASVQTDPLQFTDSRANRLLQGLGHLVYAEDGAVGGQDAPLSCGDSNYSSIMKEDQSILAFIPRGESAETSAPPSLPPPPATPPPPAAAPAPLAPPVTKRDIMVGTEPTQLRSASTKTETPRSCDKDMITEVHMADLDYLTEEFLRLKKAKEELKELKERMKSSRGCTVKKEHESLQRAQQAELDLLALQYHLCRLYWTFAEGDQVPEGPEDPNSSRVQQLDSDFLQMRAEVLAGVPLKQLKPLSVGGYAPAQIVAEVLGRVSQTGPGCEGGQSRTSSQRREESCSKVRGAVTLLLQEKNTVAHAQKKLEETQTVSKELSSSEAWYDAEENLQPETGRDAAKDELSGECSEKGAEEKRLSVSNLPPHVTQSDVMMWFEKYEASEVSISETDVGVAIVTVSSSQSAEAAVRELNGCNMQGHTVGVQVIRPTGGSQNQDSISPPEAAQADQKPQTANAKPSDPEGQLVYQLPLSFGLRSRIVVCPSPSAEETGEPQYYCTMDGLERLLSELRQRHPEVSRQRILDALVSLRATCHGTLSGLSLSTIRDRTSDLLTEAPL